MIVEPEAEWLRKTLPEGFPANTPTLGSGPGGSGKPLIGYIFASEWLKKGSRVAFILTSTTPEYLKNTMKLLGTNLDDYYGLDPTIERIKIVGNDHIRVNFIKPEVWDETLSLTDIYLNNTPSELGTMVVGGRSEPALLLPDLRESYPRKDRGNAEGVIRRRPTSSR